MAPVNPSFGIAGEQIQHISRSLASSISVPQPTISHRQISDDIYASIHKATPFIPRTIHYVSQLLKHDSAATPLPGTISKRQTRIVAVPAEYAGLNSGPAPGAVAGIVLGSVGGFLLILWLIYSCFSMGRFGGGDEVIEEEVVRRKSRSPRRSRMRSETIEISKSRSPPRRERVVVEETRRVSRPSEPEPEATEPIDDIVEVIEERSESPSIPPSRRPSRRAPGGFRTVDPAEFGGGDRPMRRVR